MVPPTASPLFVIHMTSPSVPPSVGSAVGVQGASGTGSAPAEAAHASVVSARQAATDPATVLVRRKLIVISC
jgi:hypothetical protein